MIMFVCFLHSQAVNIPTAFPHATGRYFRSQLSMHPHVTFIPSATSTTNLSSRGTGICGETKVHEEAGDYVSACVGYQGIKGTYFIVFLIGNFFLFWIFVPTTSYYAFGIYIYDITDFLSVNPTYITIFFTEPNSFAQREKGFMIRWLQSHSCLDTVYPNKYAHGVVVLCIVVVMQSFIMNSHEVFIHIHQGCFAGTGAIVRLPQCQWSKPDGYEKSVNV